VLTPTGYRCKECVRGQLKKFDTARWWDYPVAFLISCVLAYLSYYLVERISFLGFFSLILAPLVGIGIAEAVRFAVRRRRSRSLPWVVLVGIVVGMSIYILPLFLSVILLPNYQFVGATASVYSIGSFIFPLGYIILAAVTAYYRLKGIRL
jgi:hypothetical protein